MTPRELFEQMWIMPHPQPGYCVVAVQRGRYQSQCSRPATHEIYGYPTCRQHGEDLLWAVGPEDSQEKRAE